MNIEPLESRIAPATFTVTVPTGTGAGSIYEALDFANQDTTADTIVFDLPTGSTVVTLQTGTPLPVIVSKVIIDGRTQPGYAGSPLVTIDGEGHFAGPGLHFQASAVGSEVYGLTVKRFGEAGIRIDANDTKVLGCEVTANFDGVKVYGAENVRIGGTGSGERNVISGNFEYGIYGYFSHGITVENNYIGLAASGQTAFGNGVRGVYLLAAQDAVVSKNVVSANGNDGIAMEEASGTALIAGNRVGVYADGTFNAASGNTGMGINVFGNATFFVGTDGTTGEANVVANNQSVGIVMGYSGTETAQIVGNIVGETRQGVNLVPAGNLTGISTYGDGAIRVGGFTAGAFNRIGFNTEAGIHADSVGTNVAGNIFVSNGTLPVDVSGGGPTPNDDDSQNAGDGYTNFPTLVGGFQDDAGAYFVSGSLVGTLANANLRVDIYGYTEATHTFTYVGTTGAMTDAAGNGAFLEPVPGIAGYTQFAATATGNGTSEMSPLAGLGVGAEIEDPHPIFRAEGNSGQQELSFVVRLLAPSATEVSVSVGAVAPQDPGPLTGLGVAVAGVDYTISPATLTFAPGETTKMVTLNIIGDTTPELVEYINLGIILPVGAVVPTKSQQLVIVTNDDTSLRVAADRKSATWLDVDGDLVTLKVTKPVLDAGDFQLVVDGTLGGQALFALNLSDAGAAAKGMNVAFSAKYDSAHKRGDGSVHVGFINAAGVDLGTVSMPGDLGRISAGDAAFGDGSVKVLSLGSWAVSGLNTVDGNGNPTSFFRGALGKLTVAGDFRGLVVVDTTADNNAAAGSIGAVSIGGDIGLGRQQGTGAIIASGKIGSVKVIGDMRGNEIARTLIQAGTTLGKVSVGAMHFADIYAAGNAHPLKAPAAVAIAGVTVRGSVEDSLIVAGRTLVALPAAFVNDGGPSPLANPDAQIGTLVVGGDWTRSSAVAGVSAGTDGFYGTQDDGLIAPSADFTNATGIVSKIASVTIKGHIYGSPTDPGTSGFVAQCIGKFIRGKTALPLNAAASPLDVLGVSIHEDVFLREVV